MKRIMIILKTATVSLFSLAALVMYSTAIAGNGPGGPGGRGGASLDPSLDSSLDSRFDTSFAIEYSSSCLSGGCHGTDTQLVEEHAGSFMTHVMVKCNACHGTHAADTVGYEKPNLTGYYPGIGATGYQVGDDRCIACHSPTVNNPAHPNRTWDCAGCHTPHGFSAGQFGKN